MSVKNTHVDPLFHPRFLGFLDGPFLLEDLSRGLGEWPTLKPILHNLWPKFFPERSFVPADAVRSDVFIKEVLLVLGLPRTPHGM